MSLFINEDTLKKINFNIVKIKRSSQFVLNTTTSKPASYLTNYIFVYQRITINEMKQKKNIILFKFFEYVITFCQ